MTRPKLRNGDLVKLKKPYDDGKMYCVVDMTVDRAEKRKLGLNRRVIYSSEGFVDVSVMGLDGILQTFKRRQLWRVPNQPRERKT